MKTIRTMAATTAALSMLATQAFAGCIGETDARALKTAAVQQELMVAAFTCGDTQGYNQFVTTYQRDLQDSDANLLAYFQRTGSTADYHSYKTSLANDFSLISTRNGQFCQAANAAFDEALDPSHPALSQIVEERPVTVNEDGGSCGVSVASSETAMLPHEDEVASVRRHHRVAELPHEDDAAIAPNDQGESVSGGSWNGNGPAY